MDFENLYPFWNQLNDEEKKLVEDTCYTEEYAKDSLMLRSTDTCEGLLTILNGMLRAYIISEEGREITLFRVFGGDVCVLSASNLMDTIEFEVNIEAAENTTVLVLPSISLNRIMKTNPYMELYLYKSATEKFSDVMWTIQQILFKKIDQRVAGFIWDECVRTGELELSITHDEIAHYIGSAREVVTKVLKYLASQDLIELKRGKIVVLDKEKLKNFL